MSTITVNKALYSFSAKDCTIVPVVKKIPSVEVINYPNTKYNEQQYILSKTYDFTIPVWCEYIKIEIPTVTSNGKTTPLTNISITSDTGVTWFDNTTDSNVFTTYVKVTGYIERADSNDVSVTYSLSLAPTTILSSNKTITFTIGESINNYCKINLSSKNIIIDTINL
jgi:hypothetical protein